MVDNGLRIIIKSVLVDVSNFTVTLSVLRKVTQHIEIKSFTIYKVVHSTWSTFTTPCGLEPGT